MEETENTENVEIITLEKFINRGYLDDLLPACVLQLLFNELNNSKNVTIAD